MSKKPTLAVFSPTLTSFGNRNWKQIGSGWTNEKSDGTKYIRIVLDFMPNQNVMTIWPVGERPDGRPAPEDETYGDSPPKEKP